MLRIKDVTNKMVIYNIEDALIQRVKMIVLQHFSTQNVRIYLFGSWARGEQKRSSDIDIDIAIEGNIDISYEITLLREKLEESTIPRRIDVVDMHHAGKALCQRIRKEGIVWKELQNDMN